MWVAVKKIARGECLVWPAPPSSQGSAGGWHVLRPASLVEVVQESIATGISFREQQEDFGNPNLCQVLAYSTPHNAGI